MQNFPSNQKTEEVKNSQVTFDEEVIKDKLNQIKLHSASLNPSESEDPQVIY